MISSLLKCPLAILVAICFPFIFCSCDDDEATTVEYILSCSEDVLKYLQPTVTYYDDQGNRHEETLTRDDFSRPSISTADNSLCVNLGTAEWRIKIIHDGAGVNDYCDVRFVKIRDLSSDVDQEYCYVASLNAAAKYQNGGKVSTNVDLKVEKPIAVHGFGFSVLMDQLVKNGLHKEVTVSANGNITIN